MQISPEALEWFEWRDRERRKHRTMTMHEFRMWCVVGDAISHPSDNGALRGGLTIVLGEDRSSGIIGKTDNG